MKARPGRLALGISVRRSSNTDVQIPTIIPEMTLMPHHAYCSDFFPRLKSLRLDFRKLRSYVATGSHYASEGSWLPEEKRAKALLCFAQGIVREFAWVGELICWRHRGRGWDFRPGPCSARFCLQDCSTYPMEIVMFCVLKGWSSSLRDLALCCLAQSGRPQAESLHPETGLTIPSRSQENRQP